jgi:hypothetical protein
MTELRSRRFHTLVAGPGYFAAICEEGRAWYKEAGSTAWKELEPLPGIEVDSVPPSPFDGAPPTLQEVQAFADFMAMTGPPSHGDTPPLPASDQQEAPPTTYDQFDQFEDPLA